LVGLVVYQTKYYEEDILQKEFDYSEQDSLFNNAGNFEDSTLNSKKIVEKRVDSHTELLDFTGDNNRKRANSSQNLELQPVNINSAGLDEFVSLPGIGEKTASKIIELRNELGKFNSIEDLLKVKGIGKAKLQKISNLIVVE